MLSLLPFHRVLIVCAILFCYGFAIWELAAYLDGRGGQALALSLGFAAAGSLLLVYLWRLRFFLRLPDQRGAPRS